MWTALKWLGFAMVAGGIAVFPFAIWFSGPWGVITLLVVAVGCVVLIPALRRRGDADGTDAPEASPFDREPNSGQSSDKA